jgi:hypothetical protein
MLRVAYAKCRYTESRQSVCSYSDWHYADCRYTEYCYSGAVQTQCHYADCFCVVRRLCYVSLYRELATCRQI